MPTNSLQKFDCDLYTANKSIQQKGFVVHTASIAYWSWNLRNVYVVFQDKKKFKAYGSAHRMQYTRGKYIDPQKGVACESSITVSSYMHEIHAVRNE